MSQFKPGDVITHSHPPRAALARAFEQRQGRRAQILGNLVQDLTQSSLRLAAILDDRQRRARLVAALALGATLLALPACGGTYEPTPALPDCSPGNTNVQLVVAPPDIEFPNCTELPCGAYCSETAGRQWCCWKGTVVR